MPTFKIYVSIPKKEIPDSFLKDASEFIARQLGKDESYVTVRVHPDTMMCHGGSCDPCGSLEVCSIGAVGTELNDGHAKAIGEFMERTLKIPKNRFYVTFFDLARSDVALNGKTFKK